MANSLSWLEAARVAASQIFKNMSQEEILEGAHLKEILNVIMKRNLKEITGQTPIQTLSAAITTNYKSDFRNSVFIPTGTPGRYVLREHIHKTRHLNPLLDSKKNNDDHSENDNNNNTSSSVPLSKITEAGK